MAKMNLQQEGSDPAQPASTKWLIYFKSGGLFVEDSSGNVIGPLQVPPAGALNNVMTSDGTKWISAAAASAGGDGLIGSRGLIGANNAGTPNTKMDFSADMVSLRNPTTKLLNVQVNTGTVTCDLTLPASGSTSTANGCDQTKISALTSQWVHFYWIWNGTTLATVASLTAPPTGPTLPSGYTHWAYIGAFRLDGSSHLVVCKIKGNKVFYNTGIAVVTASTAINTETAVDVSAQVPPNAQTFYLTGYMYAKNDTVNVLISAQIRFATGADYYLLNSIITAVNTFVSSPVIVEVPNVGQNFYYRWTANAGISSNPSQSIIISFYSVPNGAG